MPQPSLKGKLMSQKSLPKNRESAQEGLEDGWVERQVVRNAFQETMRKLDELPHFPGKELLLEMVETTKFKILKQSKSTAYVAAKSAPKRGAAAEPTADQREAHSARIARMRQVAGQ
jgi:hypothetical protein